MGSIIHERQFQPHNRTNNKYGKFEIVTNNKNNKTPTRERAVPIEIVELGVEKIPWEESSNWGWEKGSTHRNKSPIAKNEREREREQQQ